MKYLKQLAIIFLLCILGQMGSLLIGGIIPGNVLAMILFFLLLLFGGMKEETVAETADFILTNMAFFFLPACLGVAEAYELLAGNVIKILAICIIATILTSLAAGYTVTFVLNWQESRRRKG